MSPPARLSHSLLALAVFAAFGPARAQTAPAESATGNFEASVSVGAGIVDGGREDRTLYDQYNGLRPGATVFGIFGADYWRRDEAKGTSVEFQASDLFTGNRELGLRWKKQGDWKFSADYREFLRRETATANTGLTGAGTTTPQIAALAGGPGTGSDLDLKIQRTGLGFGYSKVLSSQWQFDASVSSEKKEGSRLWGIGFNCPSPLAPGCRGSTGSEVGGPVLFLPEPINSNHSQLEARVSFAGDKLRLSGGYYGSFYRNSNGSMDADVPASLYNPLGVLLPLSTGLRPLLGQPVALAPDNQAHHLDLTGTYGFTRTTQLNFKLGYSRATQNQNFAAAGLGGAPAGVTDLGGKVSTSLAQVGVTSRPMPKLALSANLRYEHKDDQTPLAPYNLEGTSTYTNRQLPRTDWKGKLEAAYQITSDWKGTVGADFQSIDRGTFTPSSAVAGITALRQKTEEAGLRAELRRRMSEDFSGAVSISTSQRDGSNWLRDNSGTGLTEVTDAAAAEAGFANGIFMPTLADRRRNKLKLQADWQPSESLSLQLAAETGRDSYSSPSEFGVHRAALNSVSLDANYTINDKWSLNGYLSHGRQELDQSRPDAAIMAFDNTATTLGIGFAGKPMANLEVGGNLSFIDDRSVYAQTLTATAGGADAALLAVSGGLPDTVFRQTTLKLFAKYTLDKQSLVRVDLVHQRTRWTDWAWNYNGTPFVFADGTTINRKQSQSVSYVGVTYIRRWP